MLRSIKEMQGYSVYVAYGEVGSAEASYLNDDSWTIRYLMVNGGGTLGDWQVLIGRG